MQRALSLPREMMITQRFIKHNIASLNYNSSFSDNTFNQVDNNRFKLALGGSWC